MDLLDRRLPPRAGRDVGLHAVADNRSEGIAKRVYLLCCPGLWCPVCIFWRGAALGATLTTGLWAAVTIIYFVLKESP
jgi:hypothetical protein